MQYMVFTTGSGFVSYPLPKCENNSTLLSYVDMILAKHNESRSAEPLSQPAPSPYAGRDRKDFETIEKRERTLARECLFGLITFEEYEKRRDGPAPSVTEPLQRNIDSLSA